MRPTTEHLAVAGDAGAIEVALDLPAAPPRGIALLAHPHPLYGGTMDNKIVTTLARTFVALGYGAVRSNFRGVGNSAGSHDHGDGETDDKMAVLAWARERLGDLPVALGGFSFGGFVITRVAKRLAEAGRPAQRIVLVGAATGTVPGLRHYATEPVPDDSIVIHGEVDETVPLANVLDWARPQLLPIVLVPGADHFFHGKLHVIRDIVMRAWRD